MNEMEVPFDMRIGSKFKTNKYGYVTVIKYYNNHTVVVVFDNTGNIRSISADKLRIGDLKDRNVAPESIMVGQQIESIEHGILTITEVTKDDIVVLVNSDNIEVRMLLSVIKMKHKIDDKCFENETSASSI